MGNLRSLGGKQTCRRKTGGWSRNPAEGCEDLVFFPVFLLSLSFYPWERGGTAGELNISKSNVYQ
jgi:hypothetical protein